MDTHHQKVERAGQGELFGVSKRHRPAHERVRRLQEKLYCKDYRRKSQRGSRLHSQHAFDLLVQRYGLIHPMRYYSKRLKRKQAMKMLESRMRESRTYGLTRGKEVRSEMAKRFNAAYFFSLLFSPAGIPVGVVVLRPADYSGPYHSIYKNHQEFPVRID